MNNRVAYRLAPTLLLADLRVGTIIPKERFDRLSQADGLDTIHRSPLADPVHTRRFKLCRLGVDCSGRWLFDRYK